MAEDSELSEDLQEQVGLIHEVLEDIGDLDVSDAGDRAEKRIERAKKRLTQAAELLQKIVDGCDDSDE